MSKQDLLNFSFEELQIYCLENNLPKFRAAQIWRWVYCFGIQSFTEMNNISKPTRHILKKLFLISRPQISEMKESKDGTIKWLFAISGNHIIETVFIPEDNRGTLCISSQAGCALACSFCATGMQGLSRNLSTSEILLHVLHQELS